MSNLKTPLGEILILIDKQEIAYDFQELSQNDSHFSGVDARFKIVIDFEPDGKMHSISLKLKPSTKVRGFVEAGDFLNALAIYNGNESIKMTVGLKGDSGYFYKDGRLQRDPYCLSDYDDVACEKSLTISYELLKTTKTSRYFFAVAWTQEVTDVSDTHTWFAGDPTMFDLD
jgi:hypothetical protein